MSHYFKPGSWNVICDRCGRQLKSHELRDEWTGLKVCFTCWEPRHPSTLIRAPDPERPIPWARPEPEDLEIATDVILTEANPLSYDIYNNLNIPLLIERNTGYIVTEEGVRISLETGAPMTTET